MTHFFKKSPAFTIKKNSTSLFFSGLLICLVPMTGCSTFKKNDPIKTSPSATEEVYFKEAQADIEKSRYDDAEKKLDDIRIFYPVGRFSKQALLELIFVKFKQDDFTASALLADKFIQSYPTHPQADYAWYVKGVAHMYEGQGGLLQYTNLNTAHRDISHLRNAYVAFDNLIKRFPNSRYVNDASKRMYFIYNQYAEHEIHVARFNIKRKAYLGAAERAKVVFLGFPQSPQTPEALATLAYSYDKLGMQDTANRYKNLLKLNYPQLLDGNTVLLEKSRSEGSWLNTLTLGLMGRPALSGNADFIQK